MPHVNGVEATRTIRSLLPDTKIIILTTFNDDEYLMSGLRAGACGYLLKDMPSEQLAEAIRSAAKGRVRSGRRWRANWSICSHKTRPRHCPAVVSELSDRKSKSCAYRRRIEQQRDRGKIIHRRRHRQEPCQQHPQQTGSARSGAGRRGSQRIGIAFDTPRLFTKR